MGERGVMQEALFYGFSLERHVPDDRMLRKIDRFVDLSEVRRHLEPYYSETVRPIDPELVIRMLIVGYSFGIAMRRGPPQSGLPLVLSIGARWRRPGSFDVLKEPPGPLPRERSAAPPFRQRGAAVQRQGLCQAKCGQYLSSW
jgi:hypothetical protein